MNRRVALAFVAVALGFTGTGQAEPLEPEYLELYGGTYSADCGDPEAARLEVHADRVIDRSGDPVRVGTELAANPVLFGKMPPEDFVIALVVALETGERAPYEIYRDERGIYITLRGWYQRDPETRYHRCESTESDSSPVVIVDGRPGTGPDEPRMPAADGTRWENSPPVLQAIAAARSYWSAKIPDFQEEVRVWGAATGAFTRPDVEQQVVLFMMSRIPRAFPSMGLAVLEDDRLVRNIAFTTIAQTVRALGDIDGDGRDELVFGGGFVGQGMVSEGVRLAAFGDEGLEDFEDATVFESACGAGYGDTGALAALLSVVPGSEIMVQEYKQPSCDSESWEPVGEAKPLEPMAAERKTVYTEISLGGAVTD